MLLEVASAIGQRRFRDAIVGIFRGKHATPLCEARYADQEFPRRLTMIPVDVNAFPFPVRLAGEFLDHEVAAENGICFCE